MTAPFDIRVLLAIRIISRAEADLGPLADGQRRDLLMDNTEWSSDDIRGFVEYIRLTPEMYTNG